MSHKILPNQPITLPYSHFYTSSRSTSAPILRVKLKPQLLVQSPPISPLVIGRKLEECTEIIVPVGGKVQINLNLNKDALEDNGLGYYVEATVKESMITLFQRNYKPLGLLPLEPVIDPSSPSDQTNTTILLNPLSASPTHNVLSKHLIPAGHPFAFLTGFDITFEWGTYKPKAPPRPPIGDPGEEGEDEDEEEDILLLDHNEMVIGIVEEEQDAESSQLNDNRMGLGINDQVGVTRDWLDRQIREGLNRLMRDHFIPRFPLIFDGGLLEYSSTFGMPRALTTSITQLLHVSKTYSTPLARDMKILIKCIAQNQEQTLSAKVQEAANLPARKNRKKRSTESQESNSSPKKKRKKSNEPPPPPDTKDIGDMDPDQRGLVYLKEVEEHRSEWEGEGHTKTEKQLNRIIGDTLGQIGRSSFEERRRRPGRLSYKKIELHDDGAEESEVSSCSAALKPLVTSEMTKIELIDADQQSEDELLICVEDDYDSFDEEDELLIQDYDWLVDQQDNESLELDNEELLLLEALSDLEDESDEVEDTIHLSDDVNPRHVYRIGQKVMDDSHTTPLFQEDHLLQHSKMPEVPDLGLLMPHIEADGRLREGEDELLIYDDDEEVDPVDECEDELLL